MVPNPSIPVLYVCKPTHWDLKGCLLAALTFWLFYKAPHIGNPAGQYKVVVINLVRDLSPKHVAKCIWIALAMAIPFYIGGYFAMAMFIRESRPLCI